MNFSKKISGTNLSLNSPSIIIGLDPGSWHFGYSVLQYQGTKISPLTYGVIDSKNTSSLLPERLLKIYRQLDLLFSKYQPHLVSIEEVFYHKNIQTAVVLSQARSMGLLLSAQYGATLKEYSARKIKLTITGTGSASKEAVKSMVCQQLNIKDPHLNLNATDALAIGLCAHYDHLHSLRFPGLSSPMKKKKKNTIWTLEAIQKKGILIRKN